MTSLVVVMNNKAAAVAADSAMTVTDGYGNTRVRMGVRKLFQLNDRCPISAMIYDSAEIMNMAWGPIMVRYRRQYGDLVLPSVEAYADHFLSFLDNYDEIFDEDAQAKAYKHYVAVLFDWVRQNVNHIVEAETEEPSKDGPRTMAEVVRVATDLVYEDVIQYDEGEPRPDLPGFDAGFAKELQRKFAVDIQNLIDETFGEARPDKNTVRKLRDIAALAVTKDFFPDFFPNTGIVFTGYGEHQITPQMVAYLVGFAVNGKLRRRLSDVKSIHTDEPVVIAPFAHDRMIHTFLTGIDRELDEFLQEQIVDLAVGIRDRTIAQMPQLNRSQRQRFAEGYSEDEIVDLIQDVMSRLDDYQYDVHTHPILMAVESLPEADLAKTAEMLVSINAFQQHVGMTIETVGGDIDVALLTNEEFHWARKGEKIREHTTEVVR